MLYKKNSAKALDDELFKNPTCEYRGAPFFSWNCKLTKELLNTQIDNMKAMGYGGFFMHVRAGMDTYYLGDEYLSLIRSCTEKAKRENMYAWLYDEDRWPSGAAGGFVTKDPAFRSRFLALVPATHLKVAENRRSYLKEGTRPLYDISNEAPKTQAVREGKPYYIATYDVILDENGALESYKRIGRGDKAVGDRWIAFSDISHDTRFNGYPYVDALNKKAIEKFIEVTHEKFKESVGDEFDGVVPAIFTDEPQYYREKILGYPTEKKMLSIAWTHDFDKTYKKTYNSDIIDHIPEIFWDVAGKTSIERHRFHDHLCQRFVDGFAKTCGQWCEKNNIKLTGHLMEEPTLRSQTAAVGEAMRSYEYFGYPGIDMLCNYTEFNTAKQTQSAVRQYGKEAMISELYGVTNWNFDFRGHKFQGDWQAAMGVTVRVPHLTWVSMKGEAKRDYPASFNYHSPWYREYPYIEDHFARLNTALTRGTPVVDIGVIHPIESAWLNWGPVASTKEKIDQMDENFKNFIEWMIFMGYDFDYLSESTMPKLCRYGVKNENGRVKLRTGKMAYSTVIVPALQTIRQSTLDTLKAFKDAGGRVIFMGECPKFVDAELSDKAKELFDACEKIPFEKLALNTALGSEREIEMRNSSGALTQNLIYQMRKDGACKWLFICNAKHPSNVDVPPVQDVNIKIRGEYKPTLYNTLTAQIEDISFVAKGGYTYVSRKMFQHDSLLLKLERSKEKSKDIAEKKYDVLCEKIFTKPVDFALDEPNVVVLDIAQYKYSGQDNWQPLMENLKIRDEVRNKLGIKVPSGYQPWALKEEAYTNTLERKFVINSEIDVCGATLAAEDVDVSEFFFDGKKLDKTVVGYFTDVAIQSIKLPDFASGEHEIVVKMPFGARTNVENLFVLGDFGTKVQGAYVTITKKPEKLGFGNVPTQGLSFYSSNVTYKCPINVCEDDCSVKVHCNFYRGALIKVFVDGKDAGNIVFSPYDLVIDNVSKGEHLVELKLFGNRYNSFAALHNTNRSATWSGPSLWRTRGDSFALDYQLCEFGIITSPIISVMKEIK